jgi:DNA-binding response OmpR family regulator
MVAAANVLLIDDDPSTAPTVERVLLYEGYQVDRAQPGDTALRRVQHHPPDLVVLGIEKSNDHWEFCRQLLDCFDGALFLLLASDTEAQRAKGLNLGAVDCLSKPFPIVEFTARVRAILRRDMSRAARGNPHPFVDGELSIDLSRKRVRRNGHSVSLTPTEFRILACFLHHVNQLLPPEQLLDEVWGPEQDRKPETLWTHIHNLRQKLEPDPEQPERIIHCPRKGYIFQVLGTGD